ncbi:MAG: hypothetical protein QG637_191 [Chloroflexota bacterium]|nr:hypothetical protein [Chloroflexota bacterium]
MSQEIGLAATRIALFLIVAAGLLLLVVSRESAEFVVLALTIGVGVVMLGVVALLARQGSIEERRTSMTEEHQGTGDDSAR